MLMACEDDEEPGDLLDRVDDDYVGDIDDQYNIIIDVHWLIL